MKRRPMKHSQNKMNWVIKEPCADWSKRELLEYINLDRQGNNNPKKPKHEN